MKKQFLKSSLLQGVGSILNVLPARRKPMVNIRSKVIKSEQERMDEAWSRTGRDLSKAMRGR